MISSDHNCKRLVAGNYDVLINEPLLTSHKSVLTDYLEHFERYETELSRHQAHHHQQLRLQQQNVDTTNQPLSPECGYINEFKLLKELSKTLKENKANLIEGETESNQRKNRYKDIIPFSHTRVILSCNPDAVTSAGQHDEESRCSVSNQSRSYINANYIQGPSGSPRAYIACQGPLSCTLNDFWRMIWECNVSVIVMACNEYESGKPKCELYWPEQIDASLTYGNFRVTLLRERQINLDFLIRKFSVKLLAPPKHRTTGSRPLDSSNNTTTNNTAINDMDQGERRLDANEQRSSPAQVNHRNNASPRPNQRLEECNRYYLSNGESSTSNESISTSDDSSNVNQRSRAWQHCHSTSTCEPETEDDREVLMERTICQFHYTTWPDHGVPDSVHPILELVRLIREVQPAEDKPILVHCSAGCGRTGTICCIDYVWGLIRMGKLDESFNLCKIISEMRQQRMAMVQTLEQYILCHRAVATLFMQQLQLISLDNNHNHELEKCNNNKLDNDTSNSSVEDSAIEDSERDELVLEGENENRENEARDERDQELGPVFI